MWQISPPDAANGIGIDIELEWTFMATIAFSYTVPTEQDKDQIIEDFARALGWKNESVHGTYAQYAREKIRERLTEIVKDYRQNIARQAAAASIPDPDIV
jgi:hypothetical protein